MNYLSPWIYATNKCNLACPYCYVKQNDKHMPRGVLLQTLGRLSRLIDTKQVDFVVLRIAGGEPMLAFEWWMDLISYFLRSYPKQTSAGLISNLTILQSYHIKYLTALNFGYGISLDGWGFSKPFKNGRSSAEIVRHNIDRLLSVNGPKNIDISTVVTTKSIEDIDKLALWIAERDLNWGVYLDHYYDGNFDTEYLANKIFDVIDVLSDYGYDILNKFKFNNVKLTKSYDGCTAGQNLIAVDTQGYVHDCQTAIYGTPTCHIEHFTPIKIPKHKLPSNCVGCPIETFCRGGCKLNNNFGATCDLMLLVHSYLLTKLRV